MASHVTLRYVCGDICMERLTHAPCQKFPPNSDNTQETDGEEKGGGKQNGKVERIGSELEGSRLQCKMRQDKAKLFLFSK